MDRRDFIAAMLGQGILLAGMPGALAMGTDAEDKPYKTTELTDAALTRLGGMSLEELREYHRRYLLDEFLPPWLDHGVDWEYGGYFRGTFPDGPPAEHEKEMYYLGRALWLFAYAYNHFGKNPRHLEAAELGRRFIVNNAMNADGTFVDSVDRRGKVMEAEANVYGNMYMILGLAELWRANGDEENLDIAALAARGVMERLVAPDYQFRFKNHGGPYQPGDRRLGAWQHFLGSLTPFLRARRDPAVEKIAELCVRNIMERHWSDENGAFFEVLDHQYQPYPHGHDQRAFSGWHSIQACWMVQDEAIRSGNRPLFREAAEKGVRVLEKAYVDGVGPVNMRDPGMDKNKVEDSPAARWGALDDMLVYCLLTLEHTHEPWAIGYYNRAFELHNSKPDYWRRQDLLHHPRRLFYSIEILDRMIERGGRTSAFLETMKAPAAD